MKYWVAKIDNCYVLTDDEQIQLQKLFKSKGWLREQEKQLRDLGLWNKESEKSLKNFGPNVRFTENNVTIFDPPIPVALSNYMSNRGRYLLYDSNDVVTISQEDDSDFEFRPSKPNSNKKVWRKNNPEFQSREIRQLHRQIAEALYKDLVAQYGNENIGCDVASSSGTYIDIVRKEKDKFIFYELKTYNQLRKNIREALGQLLEYAYWKRNRKKTIKDIVIVSEKPLDKISNEYLDFLNKTFNIPISYLNQSL